MKSIEEIKYRQDDIDDMREDNEDDGVLRARTETLGWVLGQTDDPAGELEIYK